MNIYKITRSLIPAIAMTACLAAPAFATAIPKSDSVITHDQITLGDVFDGVTADADHYLAPAPELGKTITLGTYDLVRISDAFNLGWTPDGSTQHVARRNLGHSESLLKALSLRSLPSARWPEQDNIHPCGPFISISHEASRATHGALPA